MNARMLRVAVLLLTVSVSAGTEASSSSKTSPSPGKGSPIVPAEDVPRMHDYDFLAPEGWQTFIKPDHILLSQTPDGTGCTIQILPLQPTSGDLEADAKAVFGMMYSGWNYQQSGPRSWTASRGRLAKGLPFHLLEAPMSITGADGRYQLEEGAALVVRAGSKIAIIAVRHRGLLAHVDCLRKYTTWRRFFNSFTVREAPPSPSPEANPAERIVGLWSQTESGASSQYVFSANGHFARAGALGTSTTHREFDVERLHLKTYAFEGDGVYSVSHALLRLKRAGAFQEDVVSYRFEEVNHGGTGWGDRLWLLTKSNFGENAVGYEREHLP